MPKFSVGNKIICVSRAHVKSDAIPVGSIQTVKDVHPLAPMVRIEGCGVWIHNNMFKTGNPLRVLEERLNESV